jgi:hypothetical protein
MFEILKSTKDTIGIYNWSVSNIAMEFLFAFIITKQSGILCVMILSKHFCIFLKRALNLQHTRKDVVGGG